MATWQVIERTGETVVQLVRERIDAEFGVGTVVVQLATTAAFPDLATTDTPVVTVLLYQVSENAERRNDLERVLADGTRSRQALGLELCYLITPWGVRTASDAATDLAATREEHRLLGLVMQALYGNAEVGRARLAENGANSVWRDLDGLQIVLDSLPVEDHYRIWDASELAYRLSATYRVRVAGLEPALEGGSSRVVEVSMGVG